MPRHCLIFTLPFLFAACGPETPIDDTPPPAPIGPLVYRVSGGFCGGGCPDLRIHRDHESLQLLVFDSDGAFVQETLATLADEPTMVIDEATAQLLAGERDFGALDPECLTYVDIAKVELSLIGSTNVVTLAYPHMCPPTGVADIDTQFAAVLTAMMDCDSGSVVSVDDDCAPVNYTNN